MLIFIDDLHFEPELSPHVRRVMQTIGDTLLHDGDLVTVLSSGPSFIEIGPTYDKKTVMEAVGKIRGSAPIPSEIFKMLESSQGPGDIRHRAQMAFYTAYRILAELEQVTNRRKAVIYVSNGYDLDPFTEGRFSRDRIQGGRFSEPTRFLIDQENPYFKLRHGHGRHRPAPADARVGVVGQPRQRHDLHRRSARAGRCRRRGHLR